MQDHHADLLLDTSGLQSDLLVVEARARGPFFWARVTKKWGTAKVARFTVPKKFSGSSKDCKIQSLLCDKASGNSKGSKIHCAKNFSGSSKDCKIQPLLCAGNSKGSQIHCAKKFSGSSKDCKIQPFTVRQSFWEQQR